MEVDDWTWWAGREERGLRRWASSVSRIKVVWAQAQRAGRRRSSLVDSRWEGLAGSEHAQWAGQAGAQWLALNGRNRRGRGNGLWEVIIGQRQNLVGGDNGEGLRGAQRAGPSGWGGLGEA